VRRREFILLLGGGAGWSLSARRRAFSQQLAGVPRVGVIISASEPHPFADAFRRGLQVLGYSDGRNIVIELRYTHTGGVIAPRNSQKSSFGRRST
jgi:putative ABC transport system substrate-binding protein